MSKQRTVVYIDGFNLYHAIEKLGGDYLKWVNLFELSRSLLHKGDELVAVRYFSAYATWLPGRYQRHRLYVAALGACGVDVHLSRFKEKDARCNACGTTWKRHEEKETDVRIALKILEDCTDGIADKVIIVSADSDLVPVLQTLKARCPKINLCVVVPPKMFGMGRDLQACAHLYFQISKTKIIESLLPEHIKLSDGTVITRPPKYAPPP